MVDSLTREKRSWNMSRIKSGDTKPEKVVRSLLHSMGYRYRLHKKDLPGRPDIVLRKYKTVVFVHGCFWHRHPGCKNTTTPKTNTDFWEKKFSENVERDIKEQAYLKSLGWNVVIVWECETEKPLEGLAMKLQENILHPVLQTANDEDMLMVAETQPEYVNRKPYKHYV